MDKERILAATPLLVKSVQAYEAAATALFKHLAETDPNFFGSELITDLVSAKRKGQAALQEAQC